MRRSPSGDPAWGAGPLLRERHDRLTSVLLVATPNSSLEDLCTSGWCFSNHNRWLCVDVARASRLGKQTLRATPTATSIPHVATLPATGRCQRVPCGVRTRDCVSRADSDLQRATSI